MIKRIFVVVALLVCLLSFLSVAQPASAHTSTTATSAVPCWGKVVPMNYQYAYMSDYANWKYHIQHLMAFTVESRPDEVSFRRINEVHVYESWNGDQGPFTDLGYYNVSYGHPVNIGDFTFYQPEPDQGAGDLTTFTDWAKSCVY